MVRFAPRMASSIAGKIWSPLSSSTTELPGEQRRAQEVAHGPRELRVADGVEVLDAVVDAPLPRGEVEDEDREGERAEDRAGDPPDQPAAVAGPFDPERAPDSGQGTTAPLGAGPSRAGAVGRSGSSFHRTLTFVHSNTGAIGAPEAPTFSCSAPLLGDLRARFPGLRQADRDRLLAAGDLLSRAAGAKRAFLLLVHRALDLLLGLGSVLPRHESSFFDGLLTTKQDLRRGTPVASSESR